jgi:hypothetical protein
MTKTTKRLTTAGLGVAAIIVCFVFLRARNRNPEPFLAEVPLSDGVNKFRLVKMVEGPLDYDWKDTTPQIQRMLPPPFGLPHVPFVPIHLNGFTTFERFPGISLLFRPVDSRGRYSSGQQRGFFHPDIEIQESTGFVFFGPGRQPPVNFAAFGAVAMTTAAIPRRDPTIKLVIRESPRPASASVAMEAANPFYQREVPVWEGESLPAKRSVDGLTVTLRGLRMESFERIGVDCHIESTVKNWHPGWKTWLEDATGNRGHRLSPFEPAWKVHIALDFRPDAEFPAASVWHVGRFRRPANQTFVELQPPKTVGGVVLQKAVLAGAGALQIQDGKLSMSPGSGKAGNGFSSSGKTTTVKGRPVQTEELESGVPFLHVHHEPVNHLKTVLVRAVSGSQVITGGLGGLTSNGKHSTIVTFKDWPDDDAEWDLEFIVAENPFVEFFVTPTPEIRDALMKPPANQF